MKQRWMARQKKTNMGGVKVSIHREFDQNCSEFEIFEFILLCFFF